MAVIMQDGDIAERRSQILQRIARPLASWNPGDIPDLIKAFATEKRFIKSEVFEQDGIDARIQALEDQEFIKDSDITGNNDPLALYILMQRAANLARRGGGKKLSEADKLALKQEHLLFHQSPSFYLTILMVMLAACCQGWGQTGINTANIKWAKYVGLDPNNSGDIWKIGATNAACYFFAAGVGCWLTPTLNNYWGRRGVIFFGAVFSFASVLGSAWTQTWQQTFACRCLLGLGMGSKAATVPIYAAETSPSKARGSFVIQWQTWVAFGIFLGFSASLIVYRREDAFRLELGSAFIPAVPLMFGIFFAPESPRYLVRNNNYKGAYRSLLRLRKRPIIAFRDLIVLHEQLKLERELLGLEGFTEEENPVIAWLSRFKELWTIRRTRRSTIAAVTVMLAQQMCGINTTAFYSSFIFSNGGASDRTALLSGWGFGLINFVFAFLAVRNIDKYGRVKLLAWTFPGMAVCLACTALAFMIEGKARIPVIALFVYLHDAFYSVGEGPVPFTYSAESFDLTHREIGMSLAVAVNLFFAGLLALVFPQMIKQMGASGALGFFAGTSALAWIMIWFLMPETKQRSLEQLSTKFDIALNDFARKRLQTALSCVLNRRGSSEHEEDIDLEYHEWDADDVERDQQNVEDVRNGVPAAHNQWQGG